VPRAGPTHVPQDVKGRLTARSLPLHHVRKPRRRAHPNGSETLGEPNQYGILFPEAGTEIPVHRREFRCGHGLAEEQPEDGLHGQCLGRWGHDADISSSGK